MAGHGHSHSHDGCCGHAHDAGEVATRGRDPRYQPDEDDEIEERRALGRITAALRQYRHHAEWEIQRWERNYRRLPEAHKKLLSHLPKKFELARDAATTNGHFYKAMLSIYQEDNPYVAPHLAVANKAANEWQTTCPTASAADLEKVRYVLKNLWRDWSSDRAAERALSYGRICDKLEQQLGPPQTDGQPQRVLVPGCGLGRLCCDIAGRGYAAEGCEFSYFMLLTSSYVLNHIREPNQWTIHPWLLTSCNNLTDEDQLRGVTIPDSHPGDIVSGPGLLSMAAGDFVEVYAAEHAASSVEAVACCFFIDTAHNIIEYLQVIYHVLKVLVNMHVHKILHMPRRRMDEPGGVFINLGPLLYHWADSHTYLTDDELSLELSLEDVITAAKTIGFELIERETVHAPYMTNPRSMLQSTYECVFWTMVKPSCSTSAKA